MRNPTRALGAIPVFALLLAGCGNSQDSADPRAGQQHSLPSVAAGHRPGPDVLYADAVDAPQLQNTGMWKASPILVSGASAYRDGEYLYQDYLYDDHGALGAPDPNDPTDVGAFLFAPTGGTFTYPTDPAYVNNAADLVEFRIKPIGQNTAFRVTLNSVTDPALSVFTFALGSSPAAISWPHSAGVKSPAAVFLTVHGSEAELLDALTLAPLSPAPSVSYDAARKQFEVLVPRSAWNPGDGKQRVTLGVGLWDAASSGYLVPSPQSATATTPGGAAPSMAAIVNVGPRFNEPWPAITEVPMTTIGDAAVGAKVQGRWWREKAQADALQLGDVSAFYDEVDFAALDARTRDDSRVPHDGPMDRIFASRYVFGQGHDPSMMCYKLGSFDAGSACIGRFVGQLQPYALYVPPGQPQPAAGWGLTLMPHSLSANYNQYAASKNQSQVGDAGAYIVLTPAGRGPDGWNSGVAEADDFEAWADVARHYALDPSRTVVTGYSMGGYGTYRMLARWPDLFAAGFSVVGIPGVANPMLANLRNTPLMMWNAAGDELVNVRSAEAAATALTDLGLRFTYWLFPSADHLTLATNDEYAPGAEFLNSFTLDRDPPHVTYVVNTAEDSAGVVADHAYWVSEIRLRDADTPIGSVDVRSEGFGVGDAQPQAVMQGAGVLTGGSKPALGYDSRELAWSPAPDAPIADALTITAANVASFTIDASRAHVSCKAKLQIDSDGPVDVKMAGCKK